MVRGLYTCVRARLTWCAVAVNARGGHHAPSAVIGDDPRPFQVPRAPIIEFPRREPARRVIGGAMGAATRSEGERVGISHAAGLHLPRTEHVGVGPSSYGPDGGVRPTAESHRRSAPCVGIGGALRNVRYDTAGPGPMYLPVKSRLTWHDTRVTVIGSAARVSPFASSTTPGAAAYDPAPPSRGPAYSVPRAGRPHAAPVASPPRAAAGPSGFGCVRDTHVHIPYGRPVAICKSLCVT